MDYMTPKEAAEKWSISERRVQVLCSSEKVEGALRFGKSWAIPKATPKPKDARFKANRMQTMKIEET